MSQITLKWNPDLLDRTSANGDKYYTEAPWPQMFGSDGDLTYWPSRKSFVTDIHRQEIYGSGRRLGWLANQITIENVKTGTSVNFFFTHADKDGSNEDTYGWNFAGITPKGERVTLLIIND